MKLLLIALGALAFAGAAQAVVNQPYAPLATDNTLAATGCVHHATGYSYSGMNTATGGSGFSAGNPASPITRTMVIEPMILTMTGTNGHSLGFWGVTVVSNPNASVPIFRFAWLQVGVGVGLFPNNGYNASGTQNFVVPHMYAEYNNPATGTYYFHDLGASSGYGHYDYYTIRQEVNGAFTALVNNVAVVTGAVVPNVNGGRYMQGLGEDLSLNDTLCEHQDVYFEHTASTGIGSGLNWYYGFDGVPLDVCFGFGYYGNFEAWNTDYGAKLHGNVGGTVGCAY